MAEQATIYEVSDYVYTLSDDGVVRQWMVMYDGSLRETTNTGQYQKRLAKEKN